MDIPSDKNCSRQAVGEMAIKESILPEFEHEMATTRLMLERVPTASATWKPHPKSRSLGELAIHIAALPHWVTWILESDSFDTAPPGGDAYSAPKFMTVEGAVATLDENVAKARRAIAAASDADLMKPWSLKHAGKTSFTMPRVSVLRTFLLNHMIHHRGQLSVYLRLRDVPLPSVYGPTADGA
jgi:uncharacterized damage-inducible protein DinB